MIKRTEETKEDIKQELEAWLVAQHQVVSPSGCYRVFWPLGASDHYGEIQDIAVKHPVIHILAKEECSHSTTPEESFDIEGMPVGPRWEPLITLPAPRPE